MRETQRVSLGVIRGLGLEELEGCRRRMHTSNETSSRASKSAAREVDASRYE